MPDPDYQLIAMRLGRTQRSTILGLDWEPSLLGCAEPTARRLTHGTQSRPPLVAMHALPDGTGYSLTDHGLRVKAVLPALPA